MRGFIGAALVLLIGCGGDPAEQGGADAGPGDVAQQDIVAGEPDAAEPDTGATVADGGEDAVDAGDGCDGCLLGEECVPEGTADPADPCRVCVVDEKGAAFGPAADGAPCTALHACVIATCQGGQCVGQPRDCDDGDPCTTDSCDTATGCAHAAADGPCDDGDACTTGEACVDGACGGGAAVGCDDGDACTTDACDPASGCTHADADGAPCDDGDACTDDEACAGGACVAGSEDPCDDGDACTSDACNPFSGCVHLPTDAACDDGDPCTADSCAEGACVHAAAADGGPCDDGNACTVGDACAAGACVPGAGAPDCDDGNPCSVDACAPATGCTHVAGPEGVPCDDGLSCTVDDLCGANAKCKGTPVDCGPCEPTFAPSVLVATSLLIAPDGHPGHGVDVDVDPGTCAPSGSCSAGIDNVGAPLGAIMNDGLDGAVAKGQVAYLLEMDWGPLPPTGAFELNLFAGEPTVAGCAPASGACSYQVWTSMIDADTCEALTSFDNAKIVDGVLSAGGPTYSFPLSLPILPGANLEVTIEAVQIHGTITLGPGGAPTGFEGALGGAVRQDVLVDAIYQIPEDVLILPADQLVGLMQTLLTLDIDTDGDGAFDAYSVGFTASAKATTIVGVAP